QLQVMGLHGKVNADDVDVDALRDMINELFTLVLDEGRDGQGAEFQETTRPLHALMQLLSQWSEHSGADEGESEASDGSSRSTGRPSKRTSSAGTASGSRKRSTGRGRAAAPPASS